MQSQQEREPNSRPGRRRARWSVGELLAGGLLLMWGACCVWMGFMSLFTPDIGHWLPRSVFLHSVFCLAGATLTLLRFRISAAWLLWCAAAVMALIAVQWIWIEPSAWEPGWQLDLTLPSLLLAVASLLFSTFLVFLGRWISSQEDSDA